MELFEWKVVKKANGLEIFRYFSEAAIEWEGYSFSEYDHIKVAPEIIGNNPGPKKITRLAFRNRFTQAEKAAIELASIDVATDPVQKRVLAASLRASMKDQESATFIDLSRSDTISGVQQLESLGLIGAGRAAQILNTPIQEVEAYNG